MKVLSVSTLSDALIRCGKYDDYRISIVFETTSHAIEFVEAFNETKQADTVPLLDKAYINTLGLPTIMFINGSEITLLGERDLYKLRSCHELICEKEVYERLTAYHADLEFIKPYHYGEYELLDGDMVWLASESQAEPSTQDDDLDKFLESFVITE